jgi:REP element-mobilizing transposase RayT
VTEGVHRYHGTRHLHFITGSCYHRQPQLDTAKGRDLPHPHPAPVRQKRFYDFNVWIEQKRIEKLRYIHRNPVKRGLVEKAEHWECSSFRCSLFGETGLVRVQFQE